MRNENEIETIASKTTIAEFLRSVAVGDENAIEIVEAIAGADGDVKERKTTLAMVNRQVRPEPLDMPKRMESPKQAHTFSDVDGFVAFLNKYGKSPVVLADVPENLIDASLDPVTPDGFEVVILRPVYHPLILPWVGMFDDPIEATDFAAFVMRHRRSIVEPDGREVALTFAQIRGDVKLQIARGRGNRSVNGVMVETEIQGERKNEPVDLPDTLVIRAPLFVGEDEVEIAVDLLVLADREGRVTVTATSPDLQRRVIETFELMVGRISESIDDAIIGRGMISFKDWTRVVDVYKELA